jgi:hypothetical protein
VLSDAVQASVERIADEIAADVLADHGGDLGER